MKVWFSRQLNTHMARKLARRWRGRQQVTLDFGNVRRVLLLELGGLGDAVNVLPVATALCERFPNAQLSVVCRDYVEELFALCADKLLSDKLEKVVGIPKSSAGVGKALNALGPTEWDAVVCTCWSTWATALALRLQATALTGFWRPWRVESFGFIPANSPSVSRGDHLQTLRFKAAAPLGIQPLQKPVVPGITARQADWESARSKFSGSHAPFVLFVPFCDDPRKSLTPREARLVCQKLCDFRLPIFLLGGKSEEQRLKILWANLRQELPVLSDFSVSELVAVLARAQLVMSVDTGAMHIAAATGVPTVGIFKATDPQRCGPLGQRVLTLRAAELQQTDWRNKVAALLVASAAA